jgi:hypothetical protein
VTAGGADGRTRRQPGGICDELATKEFVRAEIAALRTELRREMGLLSWKMAGMFLLQAGLDAA